MAKKSLKSNSETLLGRINADVLAFTVGKDPILDMELALWDCVGTAAHVTMLSEMRVKPAVMTTEERKRVVAALLEIMREVRAGKFAITAADQDVHLAVERYLTERLGELGRKVHTARSRNDQVAVDIRLHIREQLLQLSDEVADLVEVLYRFGRRHVKVAMVGRTHLQPAMPSSVGLWATGYAEMLLDDLLPTEAAYITNDRSPLGSAAGYGVPLPIDRRLTANLLGFSRPHHNVFHASNARGKNEAVVLAACGQIMLTLSRLAEDLILFSMPEFGYFVLPPELCTGSSIMPQKYNPDVLELIRAKAGVVLGYGSAVNTIIKALPGGYNRDLQDTKELYMEGLRVTRASLRMMRLMVEQLKVDRERLLAGFTPGVFATDRALELVAGGMAFRDAYQQVRYHLDELGSVDPQAAIALKEHEGGTAGIDFEFYKVRVKEVRGWVKGRRSVISRCLSKLLGVPWPKTAQEF